MIVNEVYGGSNHYRLPEVLIATTQYMKDITYASFVLLKTRHLTPRWQYK